MLSCMVHGCFPWSESSTKSTIQCEVRHNSSASLKFPGHRFTKKNQISIVDEIIRCLTLEISQVEIRRACVFWPGRGGGHTNRDAIRFLC